jgi:hypothetical protein
MVGDYRNFIENYTSLSSPLRKILTKISTFEWTDVHNVSFNTLKKDLTNEILSFI